MRLLCDTNVLIYLAKGGLCKSGLDLLEDYANQVYYSPLSVVIILVEHE